MSTTTLQSLLHNPYGMEHPYSQELVERFPRDPVEGQAVTLGIATAPSGSADAVWASWVLENSGAEDKTEGQWIRDDPAQSYWQVRLPTFSQGRRITYRLHARQGNRQLDSEAFSFVVSGWRHIGDVVTYRLHTNHLELECARGDRGLQPRAKITCYAPNQLQIQWTVGNWADRSQVAGVAGQSASVPIAFRLLEETEDCIRVGNASVQVTAYRRPFRLAVSKPNGAPLLEAEPPAWLIGEGNRALRMRETFASSSDEAFYGFGERYNALNQRGNELDVRVFEEYKNQGRRTYLPVPFFLSSRGYGMYIASNRHINYDLAASQSTQWSFDAELGPDGYLESYFLIGEPKQIIHAFTDLTGKPTLPPTWVFGPWMSSNEWNSQAKVMEQVRKTIEHDIPATTLVIEAWSDESTFYLWNDAQYKPKPADE